MRAVRRIARTARRSQPAIVLAISALVGAITCATAAGQAVKHKKPSPSPAAAKVAESFTNTWQGIHLGLDFDYQVHDTAAMARAVDYVFGGLFVDWDPEPDAPVRHADVYLPFDTDGYPQTGPGHSLSDWQQTHPDWIVYKCDRKTPAYYGAGNTNVPLDFTNPAVQAYELGEAASAFRRGADGVAFDNYTFRNYEGRCGIYRNGVWTPLGFPGVWQSSARYDNAMLAWLRDFHNLLVQQYPDKTLALNMNFFLSGFDKAPLIAPYIDVLFDEGGFTGYGTRLRDAFPWLHEAQVLEYFGDLGKVVDVNGIVDAPNDASVSPSQINWVLANYLLIKRQYTYTYIYAGDRRGFTGSPSTYGSFYDRPQYHVPIGHPVSARYQSAELQMRNYSGGLAIVNPLRTQSRTVVLNGSYEDMFGQRYRTSVTLPPKSAIVLLSTG